MCGCIDAIDEMLKPSNLSLCVTYTVNFKTGAKGGVYPSLTTEPLTSGKPRPKRRTILPTFCPFCGENYGTGKRLPPDARPRGG